MFGIKKTPKTFSRIPVDLSLEQTINADAASQQKGIGYLTDSIAARQKWAESHFLRMSIISDIYLEHALTGRGDITNDFRHYKIQKDNDSLNRIMAMVKDTLNPFDENNDKEKLYDLTTGKVVRSNTEEFMLSIKTNGENLCKNFIKECVENPSRFEKPIKKQKMYTFATESGKKKVKKEGKVVSTCLIRDLFGSILNISLETKTDVGEVLSYPLTSFPLSLSHVDGNIHKTPKSAILSHLESKIISTEPKRKDVTIVDAIFFLHLNLHLPLTFGGLTTYLL